jgi:hypothetical protein
MGGTQAGAARSTRDTLIGCAAGVLALGSLAHVLLLAAGSQWGELVSYRGPTAVRVLAMVEGTLEAAAFLGFTAAFLGDGDGRDGR